MNDITERKCHMWQHEIKSQWHDWAEQGMSLRDNLIWGRDNKVWVGLGYSSWTHCVKGIAKEIQISERHIWRVIKQAPQLAESETANVSESDENTPLTAPKTQIPLTSNTDEDPEFPDRSLPIIEAYVDKTKRQVPEGLIAFFREYDDQMRPVELLLRQISRAFDDMYNPKERVWKDFRIDHVKKHISNIKEEIRKRRPWAWCPRCGGDGGIEGNCDSCHGTGWLIWIEWVAIEKELKD